MYYIILYYIVLYCIILYCIISYYIILYYTILYYIILYYIILYYYIILLLYYIILLLYIYIILYYIYILSCIIYIYIYIISLYILCILCCIYFIFLYIYTYSWCNDEALLLSLLLSLIYLESDFLDLLSQRFAAALCSYWLIHHGKIWYGNYCWDCLWPWQITDLTDLILFRLQIPLQKESLLPIFLNSMYLKVSQEAFGNIAMQNNIRKSSGEINCLSAEARAMLRVDCVTEVTWDLGW